MSKLSVQCLLVLCIGICLIADHPSNGQCLKANEEWTTCGTACPRLCDLKEPRMCTMQCVIGCQCKTDYLRRGDGECVLEKDC